MSELKITVRNDGPLRLEGDAPALDRHRTDCQQRIVLRIQSAGFHVDHAPAHLGKRLPEVDFLPGQRRAPRAAGSIQWRQRFGKWPDHSL